jgi:undecaprenyl-diphosphatase
VTDLLRAIILGIVQGLTEFIPVSSSGHLVLVPELLGWERPGLPFDVALHVGTVGAILIYFRAELWGMARHVVRPDGSEASRLYRRLAGLLALATIPVAIAGLFLEGVFARAFATPSVAAGFLLVTAATLLTGEWFRRRRRARPLPAGHRPAGAVEDEERIGVPLGGDDGDPAGLTVDRIGVREAVIVGLAQVLALFPGMSRSGTTITAGLGAGLTREAATRFSFLLALPALAGAAVVGLPGLGDSDIYSGPAIAAGIAAAGVSGYLAIAFLVRLVSRVGLYPFVAYLVVAGSVSLLATAAG